ncbi:hypothetical protein ISU10_05680 [Nocardioides agariphilus]|uniref:Right handed beta helix region n=1 Tax=Nocardioides agariphilus TaxID=433664 RepID=A0A930VID7_9ACTN|nr:hypothetical protein [Nocardioides agariphilus]MBF4767253.1 hypothetical protein [Nocardioides agariphilus]
MSRLARSCRLLVALVIATTGCLVALGVPAATAVGVIDFVAPVTDNYKTWIEDRQADPGRTDNRTSLLFSGISVGETTYVVPQSVRDSDGSLSGAAVPYDGVGGIPLATSVDGSIVARLRFDHDGGNAWSVFRLWKDGTFGPLMTIDRPTFVADPQSAVAGTFTLTSTTGAGVLGTRAMRYRYDAGIAALPETSVEWHGPLGRWYAGTDTTAPTPLNWPAATAASSQPSGAHQSQISVPAGEVSSVYVAPVDIAGLAVPRFTGDLGLVWTPAGTGRPTSTTGSEAWRNVPVTLPAGSYGLQVSGTCVDACRYDYQPQTLTAASSTVTAADAPAVTYQPDAEVRATSSDWAGAGVVNTSGADQTVASSIPLGSSRTFEVRVTNAGTTTDTFGLADARSGDHVAYDVTWTYAGGDVTTQVHDDGWFLLPDVAPGASRTLQLTVTARSGEPLGSAASFFLHAYHSPAGEGIKDVVAVSAASTPADLGSGGEYVRPPGAPEPPIQQCSRYAAADGDDANDGTMASPVLSLGRLTAVLQPGQTGCLTGADPIHMTVGGSGVMSGGTAGQPKIIRPATLGERFSVRSDPKFLVPATAHDLIVMDVDFRGSPDAGGGNLLQVNGDRVMLDGVDISWPRNICLGVGASGQEAEDFVLIDSRIHDCGATHDNNPGDVGGAHGAYLQFVRDSGDADGWGAIVYNTLFDHNDGRGLQLYPDADQVLVDHAVMYDNGSNLNVGSDSSTVRSEGSRIRHTILGNARLDFDDPVDPNPSNSNDVVGNFSGADNNGADNRIVDSCLYNTVRPGYLFDTGGTGNLSLENVTQNQPATFVDVANGDYRLTADSACLGTGLTDAARLPGGPGEPQDQLLTWSTRPRIAGTLRVGRTLRATRGEWVAAPVGYRYRWFVGGAKVKGARGAGRTLLLRKAYRGKRVSVRITVLAPDSYLDRRLTLRRSGKIR